MLLAKFHKRVEHYCTKNLPIAGRLFALLNDLRVIELRENVEANFDEEVLRNYENGKGKKDSFVFLLKIERIEDDFIEVMRITYSHTLEDILRIFKTVREKSGLNLKLLYN